jgi:hypothetical protein
VNAEETAEITYQLISTTAARRRIDRHEFVSAPTAEPR